MNESSVRPRPEPRAVDAKQGMVINCAAYHGGCRVADIDLDQAREVDSSDGRFVWIGLHEPDQPLLRTVQQRFGLHDLAIEDALRAHQRPKLEIYEDSLFIVLRTASLQDRKIRCGETHIFAGRGYVVTVRHGSTTISQFCKNSKARWTRWRTPSFPAPPTDRMSSGFTDSGTNCCCCGARSSRCRRCATE